MMHIQRMVRVAAALLAVAAASCRSVPENTSETMNTIEEQTADTVLTPEGMWRLGRVGGLHVSPDGRTLLYSVQRYRLAENKGCRTWYTLPLGAGMSADAQPVPVPFGSDVQARDVVWSPDGRALYYLAPHDGATQLWRMAPDGSGARCLSRVQGGVDAFLLSPDGRQVLYAAQVEPGPRPGRYDDLPLATGRLYQDLMFRHWDEWMQTVPHPFLAQNGPDGLTDAVDLMQGEPYESPMRPFGGVEQWAWSPDSRCVIYTSRKKQGTAMAVSTHSDLYLYDVEAHTTRNITASPSSPADTAGAAPTVLRPAPQPVRAGRTVTSARAGYNQNPVFSPDGRYVAYESMERDGYESDWNRLMVYDHQRHCHLWLATAFDGDVSSVCWAPDSRTLYFVSATDATGQVFRTHVDDGLVEPVTGGLWNLHDLMPAGSRLLAYRQTLLRPDEICLIDPGTGSVAALTDENGPALAALHRPEMVRRTVTATDGAPLTVWEVRPPDFDARRTYPLILFCTGGPQGHNGPFWSYRWNLSLMASAGYVAVMPERRGVSGLGQAWKEQISRDYPGQNMQDYLAAADFMAAQPYVDAGRMGCVGASYGGYSVYWLAGHHAHRFKAFVAHSGIFNAEAQYLETDELFFENWDAGSFWDRRDDAAVEAYYASSPHLYADRWDTPILCIHGEKDFRISYTQSLQAFTAARLRGIEAELLVFPDENHWVTEPQNAVLWQRTFFEWLDRWLKQPGSLQ